MCSCLGQQATGCSGCSRAEGIMRHVCLMNVSLYERFVFRTPYSVNSRVLPMDSRNLLVNNLFTHVTPVPSHGGERQCAGRLIRVQESFCTVSSTWM